MQKSVRGRDAVSRVKGFTRFVGGAGFRALGVAALVMFVGAACDRAEEMTRPLDVEVMAPSGPANIIIENGEGHFFFLSPIDDDDSNGDFNPGLATDVEICEWNRGAEEPCVSVVESFETSEIQIDEDDEVYQVNWKIKDTSGIQKGTLYAIRVSASGVNLGSAEVVIGKNARDARQYADALGGGVIPLTENQTLPIKYRIEHGVFCTGECVEVAITNDGGGTVTSPGEDVGATFPPDALPDTLEDVTVIVEELELGPGDECLGDLAVLTTAGRCIRFDTEPKLEGGFEEPIVVGICFDDNDVPAGVDPENFLIHRFDPDNPGQGIEALAGAPAPFLDCSAYNIAQLDRGPISRFAHAGLNALKRLVGPSPLAARDEGFGGVTSRFSYFQWALPIEITAASATSQVAAPGATVGDAPTVQVLTDHNHGSAPQVPAPDQSVTFTFYDVGGADLGSVTVLSDNNGYASVPWTLTNNPGVQSVEATAFNTGTVTFEATALALAGSFENPPTSWTSTSSPAGTSNAWVVLDPSTITNAAVTNGYVNLPAGSTSSGLPSAYDGTYAVWFGNSSGGSSTTGNYMGIAATQGPGSGGTSLGAQSGTFTSPVFTVPTPGAGETAILSFQTWWEIESVNPSSFDIMAVAVRTANGQITQLGVLNPSSDPVGGGPTIPYTSGGLNQPPVWTQVTVDISAFAGQAIQVLFSFGSSDGLYNGFRGWLIDDVQVVIDQAAAGAIMGYGNAGMGFGGGASGSGGLNPVPAQSERDK